MGKFGSDAVISIVNGFSSGSILYFHTIPSIPDYGGKITLSGALTADTYKEILSITGAGYLDFCAAAAVDNVVRTIGLKIVLDGVTVFDAGCQTNASDKGLIGVGMLTPSTGFTYIPQPSRFLTSLSVWLKSSITETDFVRLVYIYRLTSS